MLPVLVPLEPAPAMLLFTHIWDFLLKIATILGITVTPLIVHDQIFGVNADVVIPTIFAGTALSIVLYRQAISISARQGRPLVQRMA